MKEKRARVRVTAEPGIILCSTILLFLRVCSHRHSKQCSCVHVSLKEKKIQVLQILHNNESTMNPHHERGILSLMHEDMCHSEVNVHKLWGQLCLSFCLLLISAAFHSGLRSSCQTALSSRGDLQGAGTCRLSGFFLFPRKIHLQLSNLVSSHEGVTSAFCLCHYLPGALSIQSVHSPSRAWENQR